MNWLRTIKTAKGKRQSLDLAALLFFLFSAALLPGSGPEPLLRFGVIGDSGTGKAAQKRVARQMENFHAQHPWEFVLTLGDNVYFRGNPEEFDEKFKDVYKNLMEAGVRFHAALGNHDRMHPESRKGMAQVEDEAFGYVGKQPEYTFEAGPVLSGGVRLARFICLDSSSWLEEIDEDRREELQRRTERLQGWLADSARYRWNILYLHPMYSFVDPLNFWGLFGHGSYEELREVLEPLILGKVDVVFAGHDHFYQKIKPQKGVHHFVSGAAGKLVPRGVEEDHPQVEFGAEEFHFMDISLSAGTMRYQAINDQGEVIHSGEIVKADNRQESTLRLRLEILRQATEASQGTLGQGRRQAKNYRVRSIPTTL